MSERFWHSAVNQRGDTLVLVVVLLPIVFVMLSLGVDLAGVIQIKTTQEEALGAVRQSVMSPQVTLVADSVDNPGECIAKAVTRSLRSFGYDGMVEVYFYEIPEDVSPPFDSPPKTRRLYAYEAVLSATYDSSFASVIGIDEVPIKSTFVTCGMPYTEVAPYIWRPVWSTANQGCWTISEGQDFPCATHEPLGLTEMPVELREELGEAVEGLQE